ncbi:MAG: UDP-N-acetylmuramoyl-tripeptide--D-alanyl-D-alanine ligase [Clostridiales bacterium]|nr:UDP-N-acetylmuramoyl-tripeptide--D-alanyl-D-alanine ligase [Clostridiales bacterium]
MARFTLQELLEATEGKLLFAPSENGGDLAAFSVNDISTDTRTIKEGDLFLALIGENFDGNNYAQKAVDAGASVLVLSKEECAVQGVPTILVEDTKIALEKIASFYRKRQNFLVVAVTGSVGKTSTREMVASALSACKKVYATKNNDNNEIGLSKTILAAPEDSEIVVLEMGMRLRGEISELTHIALPDIAVITNIGVAHLERLGSREEILKAKLEILEGLKEGGLLIIPAADKMLAMAREKNWIRKDVKIAYVSAEGAPIPEGACGSAASSEMTFQDGKICFQVEAGFEERIKKTLAISVIGIHHVGNALVGFLCGLYLHLSPDKLAEGIASFSQIGHREKLKDEAGVHFLDDAYNAGPESMSSAMTSIRRLAGSARAFACIGDMLELGEVSEEKHFEIGAHAALEKLDGLFVIGDYKEKVKEGVASVDPSLPVFLCKDKEEIVNRLREIVKPGDFVLLKASHSFEMYTISEEYASIFKEGEC